MTFDVDKIVREVEAASEALSGDWLQASWDDPSGFMQALAQHQLSSAATSSKSRVGAGVDLGHDLILRHLPSERAALRWFDTRAGWQELTYTELERRSGSRARSWLAQGVNPGDVIALVHPVGAELAVSLLAALRIGAVSAPVVPAGRAHVEQRITRLSPARIATEPLYLPFLSKSAALLLAPEGRGVAPLLRSASCTYPEGEPILVTCSPLDPEEAPPVEVPCEVLWTGALRDAALTYGLRAGENLAAPGFDAEQHQPALLFAAWLAGATYVHIEVEALRQEPTLLFAQPLRCLGVSVEVRDLLLNAGSRPPHAWGHWFRNPEELFDGEAWRSFIDKLDLRAVAHSNVVIDTAAGGAVLSSRRVRGKVVPDALPAPGRAWKLIDPVKAGAAGVPQDSKGASAISRTGVFVCGSTERPGYLLLSGIGSGFRYAGTCTPRRAGRVFPAEAACRSVAALPFVRGAIVVPVPAGGALYRTYFTLVVFTGDEAAEDAVKLTGERVEKLRRQIVVDLGADALPDRTELFPLYPRTSGEGLDEKWCRAQYLMGGLHRKVRDPASQLLTHLRGLCELDRG